jgi:hypothetical protein
VLGMGVGRWIPMESVISPHFLFPYPFSMFGVYWYY